MIAGTKYIEGMSDEHTVIPFPVRRRRTAVRSCPICGKAAAAAHDPFCSARCKQVDLGRWLNGTYRVETDEKPEDTAGTGDESSDG